jgi:L-rhamnose mutarotase
LSAKQGELVIHIYKALQSTYLTKEITVFNCLHDILVACGAGNYDVHIRNESTLTMWFPTVTEANAFDALISKSWRSMVWADQKNQPKAQITIALTKSDVAYVHGYFNGKNSVHAQTGQGLVEYALIMVLLAALAVVVVLALAHYCGPLLQNITSTIPSMPADYGQSIIKGIQLFFSISK